MKKLIYILLCSLVAISCSDFLDREPYDKVDSDKYFQNENDVEIFSNYFLNMYFSTDSYGDLAYGDRYVDFLTNSKFSAFYTGNFTAANQGGWSTSKWKELRNINYFLDNLRNADASETVLDHFEGVGRFWRAWFYFGMVKTFGDVPWYEHEIQSYDTESLYKPQDPREYVMDKVMEDLLYACNHCSSASRYVNGSCRINKWVAMAFASRVFLFEGTYRKYHTELGLTASAEKYLRAAVEIAEQLMEDGPYRLVDNDANRDTQWRNLFIAEDGNTTELILMNAYAQGQREHVVTKNYYSLTAVGESWGFTKQFVNTYLMQDGTRFTDRAGYRTVEFVNEFDGRDLRMKQTMRYPGYVRTISGVANTRTSPDVKVSPTGYQPIKWCWDDDYYDNMNTWNDISVLRYAEVLLNYAEALAELGELDRTSWDKSIRLLRERAGVNGDIPTVYDPYLEEYYMNQTNDMWILEVRRERAIELALEGFRQQDLYRWKLGEMLIKPWYGIYIPQKGVSYDLDGDGTKDICVDDSKGNEAGVEYLILDNIISLTNGTSGYIEYANPRIWEERRYLRPIPESAMIDNPNLVQNSGWEN